ncbi:hypothetical protein [Granulicella tundricola]|uniref:Uncharacterized protein n=1 Tax=Granulicella tundricola (strain ATCC BAA-1859 / DSM 23138 / MP5ACTX9) TaxID=1198114 RepID=E8X4Y6_GRATM|nr:hypothetical protein [Granulicella tundricola]ADW67178.1 hypothetical protein AciX9_0088 [Granulicella tundricola MP5ACTX9]
MVLEVRGIEQSTQKFIQLWGKHVSGFNPQKQCIHCLKGRNEPQINRGMTSGDYEILTGAPYFYLFAMGRAPRSDSNVHLAVQPYPGAAASIVSLYGVTFTIRDARALRIDRIPGGWLGMDDLFTTFRSFQFGVQMFGYHLPENTPKTGDYSLLPEGI